MGSIIFGILSIIYILYLAIQKGSWTFLYWCKYAVTGCLLGLIIAFIFHKIFRLFSLKLEETNPNSQNFNLIFISSSIASYCWLMTLGLPTDDFKILYLALCFGIPSILTSNNEGGWVASTTGMFFAILTFFNKNYPAFIVDFFK